MSLPLPSFGKDLLARRFRGEHPQRLWVLLGDDWSRAPLGDGFVLACKAADDPRKREWSICAGLPVHLVLRKHPLWLTAAMLIARHAAPVVLHPGGAPTYTYGLQSDTSTAERYVRAMEPPALGRDMVAGHPMDLADLFPLWNSQRPATMPDWSREDEAEYLDHRWRYVLAQELQRHRDAEREYNVKSPATAALHRAAHGATERSA